MSKKKPKTVTIYVTSRALTEGIVKMEAVPVPNFSNYMRVPATGPSGSSEGTDFYSSDEYCLTRPQAVARAEAMRAKRLACMEKQMAQIAALTFKEVTHEA